MAISALSELEIKVIRDLAHRPGTNLVMDALREAWREFLTQSEVWREDLTAFDAVEDQASYTLTPSDGEIIRITKVELDESELDPDTYYLDGTNDLVFEEDYVPTEDSTDGLEVQVALSPEINDTNDPGPAWALNKWSDGIVAGAQALLYRQAGRKWHNPQMYRERQADFEGAIGMAVVAKDQKRTTRKTGFSG
jgi:hypothetical protein